MEDTLVSFEVAKSLEEKGFKDTIGIFNGKHYYNYKGELDGDQTDYLKSRIRKEDLTPFRNYSAPTLSVAQKWLREVHNIHIVISVDFYKDGINYLWQVFRYDTTQKYCCTGTACYGDNGEYPTYELALEFGIQTALKLIK